MLMVMRKVEYQNARIDVLDDKPYVGVVAVAFAKSKAQIKRIIVQKGLDMSDYQILNIKETK